MLKAIVYTTLVCSSSERSSFPVLVSQTLHVLSYEPVMNLSPDLLNAQLVRGSKWALNTLKSANFYSWFSCCFSMSFSMSFLSWGLRDSDIRGSSSRIWSINRSMSVLQPIPGQFKFKLVSQLVRPFPRNNSEKVVHLCKSKFEI